MKTENQNKEEQGKADEPMSLSKERKLARKHEIARQKRNAVIGRVVSIVIIAALCVGVVSFAGYRIYRAITGVKPSSDYSALLDENGFIEGVTASSYVTLPDYQNLTIPAEEVEYTDEELEEDIAELVEGYAAENTTTDKAIEDGDMVNIDFVGSIDGVEFEGGSTEGEGYDLVIGSGTMIGTFEEQLIGHQIGDEVIIQASFPDDYEVNPSLAGEDAAFRVTVNSIYIAPEFDDTFVTEYLSDYASTAEEYREYLREENYDNNLTEWINTYLTENTTVSAYPEEYLDHIVSIQKYEDETAYEYMNELYQSYYGVPAYGSFSDYTGMSDIEYDESLPTLVQDRVTETLIYQAILEQEGVTVTEDEFVAYLEENGSSREEYESDVENFGQGYMMQQMVSIRAIEMIKGYATVE